MNLCSAGSEYNMADLHLYPIFERFPAIRLLGTDVLPADKFPRVGAWLSAMQRQNCVRKVWISPEIHHRMWLLLKEERDDVVPYDVEMDDQTIAVQSSVA